MGAVEAAENVVLRRPAHVVADEQVEQAVAVVIDPERGSAEPLAGLEAGGASDIGKFAVTVIAEEMALADAGDENVGEAVVVVIADGYAHAVHFDIEAGGAGDVGERTVAIVAIETLAWIFGACGRASPCH